MSFGEKPTIELDASTRQALADLGFPRNTWTSLQKSKIEGIIHNQITYETFIKGNKQEKQKNITPEFRQKYKEAFEKLETHVDMVDMIDNPTQKELLLKVLKLGGEVQTVTEIDTFIESNKENLSEEEIDFLNMKKEWLAL